MNQYAAITNKVSVKIFNFKIKDFNRFIKFKEIYALDSCSVPILGVNDITGIQIASINPTLTLNLEGMCLCTLNDLAVNVKLNKSVYLINSGGYTTLGQNS